MRVTDDVRTGPRSARRQPALRRPAGRSDSHKPRTSRRGPLKGDTDYYHLGARYYMPATSRFTQPDSIIGNVANPKTINLYTYGAGDPIDNADPTGRCDIVSCIVGGFELFGGLGDVAFGGGIAILGITTAGFGWGVLGIGAGLAIASGGIAEIYAGWEDITD